ncbi:CASP-like protein 4A4 isoform X1 [Macadamia integrifolia]|uniref:CASP-like protein 4A4 isoform X1 n=1 Tax=Macadamia integrifolia TaxID=60698 RepID=UPI001C4FB2A1|nr:CASP-like protein 4A4 isoform X1 [Macadamia integrifolia]
MKENRATGGDLFGAMAAGSSPPRLYSPAQPQYPTPSSFTINSIGSTTWSSKPTLHLCNLFIRSLAFLFSFISAISLVAPSPNKKKDEATFSFGLHPELWYSFGVTILASIYTAFQLFKGVFDIVHRGLLISDLVSDYLSFILDHVSNALIKDHLSFYLFFLPFLGLLMNGLLAGGMQQLLCYLLISSSSLSVPAILRIESVSPIWKATIVSVSMSFAAFLVFVACSLLSGYKLCKRIIW